MRVPSPGAPSPMTWPFVTLWRSGVAGVLLCSIARAAEIAFFRAAGGENAVRLVLSGLAFMPNAPIRLEPFLQVLTILPTLVFWFWLGGTVRNRIGLESSLVLPRCGSRRSWAHAQLAFLAICALAYSLFSNAGAYLVSSVVGDGTPPMAAMLLPNVALETPVLVLGVAAANLLSFKTDALIAFAIVAGAHVATLLLAPSVLASLPVLALVLPSTSGLLETRAHLAQGATMTASPLVQVGSCALLFLLALLACHALVTCIRRCDLL